jgi:hypothetical protein
MSSVVLQPAAREGERAARVRAWAVPGHAWLRGAGVLALLSLLAVFFTWPLATGLASQAIWHFDTPFSIWRLAWVAHQVFADPAHLFDGNTFYPEPRTLAYSDAMLLPGLFATPLIKAGLSPLLAMNLSLFGAFVSSGGGMYLLARRLTGNTAAAILAAIIFAFAPYRADHLMHLELQWAAWIPLTLWAFHRTLSEGRVRDGVMTGVFVLLQLLSSIYYALFLCATLIIAGIVSLILWRSRVTPRVLIGFAIGAVLLVAVAVPYSRPYRENAKTVGHRSPYEITVYSARPVSYLAVPPENALYGPLTGKWSGPETRLFPGVVALVLLALAFVPPVCSTRWLYLVVLAFAVEASFGLNGRLYPWLHAWLTPFQGLRAPGRFGILVLLAVGVLAAHGASRVLRVTPAQWRRPLTVLLGGVMMLEYQMGPSYMESLPVDPPPVYRWLAREPPHTVTIEFPVPQPEWVPYHDAWYMYFSTMHWQPLVNGYSGHYPPSYMEFLKRLKPFPSEETLDVLRERGVQAIIVHEALYERPNEYTRTYAWLETHPDVRLMGIWRDHRSEARAYKLQPRTTARQ